MADDKKPPSVDLLSCLAWDSFFAALRKMPMLFVSVSALMVAIGLIEATGIYMPLLVWANLANIPPVVTDTVALLISWVVSALVQAPVAVAVHRMILLEEIAKGPISWHGERVWAFAAWTFAVTAACGLVEKLISLGSETRLEWPLLVLGIVVSVIVAVRSVLLFPAVAIEAPADSIQDRLVMSWRSSRGHSWRIAVALFLAIGLLIVPAVLVFVVVTLLLSFGNDWAASVLIGVKAVVPELLRPVTISLGAGVASWMYMWVQENPRETPTLPQPPHEI